MIHTPWDLIYREHLQRQAFQRQVAADKANLEARVRSMNFLGERQSEIPIGQQMEYFQRMAEEERKRKEEAKKKAEAEAKARAEKNQREFYERMKKYKGPFDPLLKLLNIKSKKPTVKEIRSCYLQAIRKHHPDAGGTEEMAKRINAAYEILLKEFG